MEAADVIVVGGGLSGAAVALGLEREGAGKVLLFDQHLKSQRLSRGNFGLTWFMCKGNGNPSYARWARMACIEWPEFAQKLEADTGYNVELEWTGGAVHAVGDQAFEAHSSSIKEIRKTCESAGIDYPVEMLDRKQFSELIPEMTLGEEVSGAMYTSEQGHINPLKLLAALRCAFQKLGGVFHGNQTVTSLIPQPGGTVIVKTSSGDYEANKVVLAAGHGSRRLLAPLGTQLNIYPQGGQIMVSQRCKRKLHVPVLSVRQTPDGTYLIGLSTDDVSLDARVTTQSMKRQAAEAIQLFPELAKVNWVRAWSAIRVMTPDGAPIYNQVPDHENITVMALHSAVSLAPLAVSKVAPWIIGSHPHELISKFNNGRFNV